MRKNYPLLSQEVNDKFQDLYYKLTYILGYTDENNDKTYIGQFDKIEDSIKVAIQNITLQYVDSDDLVIFNSINSLQLYSIWGKQMLIHKLRRL